jgi:hypothetical protein
VDDTLDNRESKTGSVKFVSIRESLKRYKQFIGRFHVKANTVVSDIIDIFIPFEITSDFNDPDFFWPCKFDRILNEIEKDLANHALISTDGRKHFEVRIDCAVGGNSFQFVKYGPCKFVHIEIRRFHLLVPGNGKSEKIIDKFQYFLCARLYNAQELLSLFIKVGEMSFQQ